jgi:hypothetical protein
MALFSTGAHAPSSSFKPRGMRFAPRCFLLGLGIAGASLMLVGCAGPAFLPNPESGVELRWPNGQGSIDEAQAKADTRCQAEAKHAVLEDEFMDRDETVARFHCG